MSRTFRRVGEHVRATLYPAEVELLHRLRDELATTLEERDPADPVIRRLFPPAVLGDAEVADEVRELFEDELLAERLAGLDELTGILERGTVSRGRLRVDLVDDEPLLVLRVLNDVRLALGARVDVEALDRSRVGPDDAAAYPLAVMDHLAWWQEQLVAIVDPPAASGPPAANDQEI